MTPPSSHEEKNPSTALPFLGWMTDDYWNWSTDGPPPALDGYGTIVHL
jgi:hypothetical protein